MSALQFQVMLALYVVLACADILTGRKAAPSLIESDVQRLGKKRAVSLSILFFLAMSAAVVSIAGMFFFKLWAAILFVVSVSLGELVNRLLFPRATATFLKHSIEVLLIVSELGLAYAIFFGPPRHLFQA